MATLSPPRSQAAPVRLRRAPFTTRDRVQVIEGVSWETYLKLDEELYTGRRRVSFCDGTIQIMSTSDLHEILKTNISRMVEHYCLYRGIPWSGRGQATRRLLGSRGGEPDESFIFTSGVELPDVVLEVALSGGGINKLTFWGGFPINEVWIWRRDALEIHSWNGRSYEARPESAFVPGLDLDLVKRMAKRQDTFAMLTEFRAAIEG